MTKTTPVDTSSELTGSRVRLRFRRHLLPVLGGLTAFIAVFVLLNLQLIEGIIAYHMYHPIDVNTLDASAAVFHPDPNAQDIIINKINVQAPVNFTETRVNQWIFLQDLQSAVVHYPGTALPGQTGNVVIFGHSSGVPWEPGKYKFIFTLLDKLTYGDKIFVDYKGTRYTYQVYNTMIVMPNDMSVLNQSGTHMLSLITCTPVGTSQKRYIVQAVQISPQVSNGTNYDKPATLPQTAQPQMDLPGDTSLWQQLLHLL